MKPPLKLYVWEDVLCDYYSGMVCVLAENEAHAWELLKEESESAYRELRGTGDPTKPLREYVERPVEVTEPQAFVLRGGA
jgi:hypothetical protein